MPLPEVTRALVKQNQKASKLGSRPRELTERLPAASIEKAARLAAQKALGAGDWVAAFVDPYVYFSETAKGLDAEKLSRLRKAISTDVSRLRGVARTFDTGAFSGSCAPPEDDSLNALVCRSIQPGCGGDLFIATLPGYFFDMGYAAGTGTNHGNAELYDRSVPLLVRAPGRTQVGMVVQAAQSFELYSRELDQLLRLGSASPSH